MLAVLVAIAVIAGFSILYLYDWAECNATGIIQLYKRYKHDPVDSIMTHCTTIRGEVNMFLNWRVIRIGIGQNGVHFSFFALPVLFKKSIAIPWSEVELVGSLEDSILPIGRTAEFRFGPDRFFLRLRGRAARLLQARLYDLAQAT